MNLNGEPKTFVCLGLFSWLKMSPIIKPTQSWQSNLLPCWLVVMNRNTNCLCVIFVVNRFIFLHLDLHGCTKTASILFLEDTLQTLKSDSRFLSDCHWILQDCLEHNFQGSCKSGCNCKKEWKSQEKVCRRKKTKQQKVKVLTEMFHRKYLKSWTKECRKTLPLCPRC